MNFNGLTLTQNSAYIVQISIENYFKGIPRRFIKKIDTRLKNENVTKENARLFLI